MADQKKIMIIAHFCDYGPENTNNRFNYIASLCAQNQFDVELVTSSFCHRSKMQRSAVRQNDCAYQTVLIAEPSYHRNISLKRLFYSHKKFAANLSDYLKKCDKPDLVYCAVPSLDAAEVAAQYCKQKGIPFIIDVQDLWPEAYKLVFHIPVLSDLLFRPMEKKANRVYGQADAVIAVSQTYVDRALSVNRKCKNGTVVYLGTEMSKFDAAASAADSSSPNGEIVIAYCGTLGHSYDLRCVMDALSILKNRGYQKVKFLVMGDGPLRKEFEDYAAEKQICCEFTGYLKYEDMVSRLIKCHITVNPITKGSAGSIINKVGDYAMAGLPVINTQESMEYRNLVDEYRMGFNCENGNADEMADRMAQLIDDPELRQKMGQNARQCGEQRFDRACTYTRILDIISGDVH